ncbi:hypothetical protein KI387_030288 [Taxus chinensis]|uniref:Uncharacterized protein n=1 Tax=Taxus chinensis TaxID=29808 RepID=A0AA38CGE6_TAXCH|nr:hypothetical protein KI387_030288 [Taxus chinensis]
MENFSPKQCGTSGTKRRESAGSGEPEEFVPRSTETFGTKGREPAGSAETGKFSTGANGTKGRVGRGSPKEPKANQTMPRVISQMRDKEAHFGRIGGFCPKQHWDIWDKRVRMSRKG